MSAGTKVPPLRAVDCSSNCIKRSMSITAVSVKYPPFKPTSTSTRPCTKKSCRAAKCRGAVGKCQRRRLPRAVAKCRRAAKCPLRLPRLPGRPPRRNPPTPVNATSGLPTRICYPPYKTAYVHRYISAYDLDQFRGHCCCSCCALPLASCTWSHGWIHSVYES